MKNVGFSDILKMTEEELALEYKEDNDISTVEDNSEDYEDELELDD